MDFTLKKEHLHSQFFSLDLYQLPEDGALKVRDTTKGWEVSQKENSIVTEYKEAIYQKENKGRIDSTDSHKVHIRSKPYAAGLTEGAAHLMEGRSKIIHFNVYPPFPYSQISRRWCDCAWT